MNNKQIKDSLKQVFDAPTPTRKQEFTDKIAATAFSPKSSRLNFFVTQASFIRKRFWILSILPLMLVLVTLQIYTSKYEHLQNFFSIDIFWILSSAIPLLTLLSVTELSKSSSFNMDELEISCKHNLSQIVLARLSIIGSFHLVIIAVILFFTVNQTDYSIIQAGIYLTVPFLLNTYLSFFTTNHLRTRESIYICGGITGAICLANVMFTPIFTYLLDIQYVPMWIIIIFVIISLMITELYKFTKNQNSLDNVNLQNR